MLMEVFGPMQQIYNLAQYSLGPDVGCYAPPMVYEKELNESLQVLNGGLLQIVIPGQIIYPGPTLSSSSTVYA